MKERGPKMGFDPLGRQLSCPPERFFGLAESEAIEELGESEGRLCVR